MFIFVRRSNRIFAAGPHKSQSLMLKWFVLILFFAALAADAYIYRSFVCPRFAGKRIRVGYLIFALVSDGAALAAMLLHETADNALVMMWLVWLFVVAAVPKLFYMLGCFLDYIIWKSRVGAFRPILFCAGMICVCAMVWGATLGRTQLRVERVEICSPRVPEAFDGYRIVQFSDLHVGSMINPGRHLARVVDLVQDQKGDVIFNTGDVVNLDHRELDGQVFDILRHVEAPDGVWSVWGNHDLGFYIREESSLTPEENIKRLEGKIDSLGWHTLSDRSDWIVRGADSILISGLDYPHDPMLNSHNARLAGVDISAVYHGIADGPFNVVLSHTPKMWDEIREQHRGDVVLSGHVHAMQTKILGWSPARFMYPQWSGKYTSPHSVLYVNDGIGSVGYPMRIGVRGEITVITLKRCE